MKEHRFKIVRMDFETRSRIDVTDTGAWVYSRHPSTEVLVLKYQVGDGPMMTWVPEPWSLGPPDGWGDMVMDAGFKFEAHNVFFEWCVYRHILQVRWGWPFIPPDRWLCSMAVACFHSLPRSLDGAGQALGLDVKKDMVGSRVMKKLSKPRKPSKNNPDPFFCDPKDFQTLYDYCEQDVRVQKAISEALGPLPGPEWMVWQVDQLMNRRGVGCDVEAAQGAIDIMDQVMAEATNHITHLTDGEVTSPGQVGKLVTWCQAQGVGVGDMTAATVKDLLEKGHMVHTGNFMGEPMMELQPLPEKVRQVLEVRQLVGKSSVKKFQAMVNRVDLADNRIRGILIYHGASTGRWAGAGIQIQNFPRGTFQFRDEKHPEAPDLEEVIQLVKDRDVDGLKDLGDIPSILSSILRSCLVAGPGKKFMAADYSAIEARVLLWLVNDTMALNVFRTGGDIYVDMASTIYGKPPSQVTKDERFVGKQAILGLGYQMGVERFMGQCESFGNPVGKDLAKKVVDTYRMKHDRVPKFWGAVQTAAINAVRTGQPVSCGRVKFFIEGSFLKCQLPSRRVLSYFGPHLVQSKWDPSDVSLAYMGVDSQKGGKWTRVHTYGGKLTENIVQAISADLLRTATLNLESNGFPVVMSVHDELVCEVSDGPVYNVGQIVDQMCHLPRWAEGLPVTAEGWEGKRFKK